MKTQPFLESVGWLFGQQTFQPLALWDQTPVRLPAGRHFLNVLCYVRSWLVDLERCETLHHKTLKKVSDGQLAVASPSVPLDRTIPHEFYTGASKGGHLVNKHFNFYDTSKQ